MRWIWLPLILLTAVHAQLPPSPPGAILIQPKPVSPKFAEQIQSWGAPMRSTPSFAPKVVTLPGFTITNLAVTGGQVTLQWKEGVPPFQVIGEPTPYGPWNDVGNPTTARSKTFPEDINHFFTVQGSIVMPLEATRTNNLTRLTWEAPDTDMSDSLQAFTLKRSTDNGATFPTTVAVVQPGGTYSVDDTTAIPPGGSLTWELLEQTLNGVVVPYSKPVASNVAPGTAMWANTYGIANSTIDNGIDNGNGVCCDASGNIFLTGYKDIGYSVQYPNGYLGEPINHYLSTLSYGMFLSKYSPAGVFIEGSAFGPFAGHSTLACIPHGLSVATANGKIIVGGVFNGTGTCDFSGTQAIPGAAISALGNTDGFIASYNDGHPFSWNWVRDIGTAVLNQFGGKQDCSVSSVAIDGSGNVFAVGFFSASVNFGDATRTTPSGTASIFLIKLRGSDGTTLWSKQLGSVEMNMGIQVANGVVVDSSGNAIITGNFRGSVANPADFGNGHTLVSNFTTDPSNIKHYLLDIFVAKYTPDGVCLWAIGHGGPNDDFSNCIAITSNNDVLIGGTASSPVDFGNGSTSLPYAWGAFIARYSGVDGSHQWSFAFPAGFANTSAATRGLVINSSGEVFTIGDFQSNGVMLPFSDGLHSFPLASSGNINTFVIKWRPNGDGHGSALVDWAKAYGTTGQQFGGTCHGNCIATGLDNNPVISGQFQGASANTGIPFTTVIDPFTLNTLGSYDIFFAKLLH